MKNKKKVLFVVIDPKYLDFTTPEFLAMPEINSEKIMNGINGSISEIIKLGCEAEPCWIDLGETAIAVMKTHLEKKNFDLVLIGAGIRIIESNFLLFEKIINSIIDFSPKSKICFNTNPMDATQAVQRWI